MGAAGMMDDQIGDTADDNPDLAHLPGPARGAMRRLREWLGEKHWNPTQAEAILCGYDPEWGHNTSPADMAFFPGAYRFYGVTDPTRDPHDLKRMADGIERKREDVRGLRLTTGSPKAVIQVAMRAGVAVPWLAEARNDPVCRKSLPRGIVPPGEGNPRGRASYAKTFGRFPNWLQQVETALRLHLEGRSRKQVKDHLAALGDVSGSVDSWLRAFEQQETEVGKRAVADSITAGMRAFLKVRDAKR
jgi:hypothetical protein